MADLLNIPIKIHALWHAGSYDPHDFLGRTIPDFISAKKYVPWIRHIEKGLFEAIDYNYFASDFHIDMFLENLLDVEERIGRIRYMRTGKITKSGWPMEYVGSTLKKEKKQDIILFPHRLAPEKQPDIFKDLQNEMPEYEFILCQEQNLQKHEYHDLLSKAKMVFSANLQETLGISCFEILAAGGMPLVPDRLSYTEMYRPAFKYPTEWSSSYESYLENKDKLITRIKNMMKYYNQYDLEIEKNFESLQKNYFSCDKICDNLK
jgi:glycosyltransferase involved in cell wall biosynthesis